MMELKAGGLPASGGSQKKRETEYMHLICGLALAIGISASTPLQGCDVVVLGADPVLEIAIELRQ